MTSPISWFELPATDLDRATAFYQRVLGNEMRRETCSGIAMAIFPYLEGHPSGAVVSMPQLVSHDNGTLVYLNAGDDLSAALARVPSAGGTVVMPKTAIGNDIGHFALFIDSEGNRVGLYSPH